MLLDQNMYIELKIPLSACIDFNLVLIKAIWWPLE